MCRFAYSTVWSRRTMRNRLPPLRFYFSFSAGNRGMPGLSSESDDRRNCSEEGMGGVRSAFGPLGTSQPLDGGGRERARRERRGSNAERQDGRLPSRGLTRWTLVCSPLRAAAGLAHATRKSSLSAPRPLCAPLSRSAAGTIARGGIPLPPGAGCRFGLLLHCSRSVAGRGVR